MSADRRRSELRLFGLNACLAVFDRRPMAIRKVYLLEARMPLLREVLRHCAAQRIGYRLVGDDDLQRLTGSQHHEGICFEVLRPQPPTLAAWLGALADRAAQAILLDGVGNPHNLGAVLRSAAHFGAAGVFVGGGGDLALSGAACRVAEGGAECVPLMAFDADVGAQLERAGFVAAATVVRDGSSLFAAPLPPRVLWLLGAEGPGLSPARLAQTPLRLSIPGTGAVDSLNVAAATAVLLAEHVRQHGVQAGSRQ